MPKHRGLTLAKFVTAVPWELFQKYFASLELENDVSHWVFISADAMGQFLNGPENQEARGVILEDFRRVNDICEQGMNHLVRAYAEFNVEFDATRTREEMAMRLFLDYKEAFEFAWTRYLLYSSSSMLSHYSVPAEKINICADTIEDFHQELTRWFSGLAKGDVCEVRCFEDGGETVMLVSHGSYIRTVSYWDGNRIAFRSYRPASEDILVYSPQESLLKIRAGLEKDRDEYRSAFLARMANGAAAADALAAQEIFTLTPLQEGRFDFAGDGKLISRIDLLQVRMKLFGVGSPMLEVKSRDLMWTFDRDLGDLSLDSGRLVFARFRFHLVPERAKRPIKVDFKIEPPARTDLAQKLYADVIEGYLMEQGVKLR